MPSFLLNNSKVQSSFSIPALNKNLKHEFWFFNSGNSEKEKKRHLLPQLGLFILLTSKLEAEQQFCKYKWNRKTHWVTWKAAAACLMWFIRKSDLFVLTAALGWICIYESTHPLWKTGNGCKRTDMWQVTVILLDLKKQWKRPNSTLGSYVFSFSFSEEEIVTVPALSCRPSQQHLGREHPQHPTTNTPVIFKQYCR